MPQQAQSRASNSSKDYSRHSSATKVGSGSANRHSGKTSSKERYQIPSFKRKDKNTQKIDPDSQMYNESHLEFSQRDVRNRKKGIEEDLTIFAPHATEHTSVLNTESESDIKMERPVTPIDREIKRQPYEWEQMSQYVRRRVAPDKKVDFLTVEDQTDLAAILVAEVYHIWPEIKRQIDDPFLSWEDNIELNRRIAVHIVTVCEQLYRHYLKKAQILMGRGVFSGPANMSRLKAQLGIEASKYLNVLMIRRYIVADMKGDLAELESTEGSYTYKFSPKKPSLPKLSFKIMLKKSRPQKEQRKKHWTTAEEDLMEIKENMPELDTSKLLTVLSELPKELLEGYATQSMRADDEIKASLTKHGDATASEKEKITSATEDAFLELYHRRFPVFRKRSNSLPQIQVGETLLQELGIDKPTQSKDTFEPLSKVSKKKYHKSYDVLFECDDKTTKPQNVDKNILSRDKINQDLQKLTEIKKEPIIQQDDDDMPPLLQAIIRHAQHDGKEEEHKKKLAELEEKERKELEERSAPLQEPQYPQPATTAQKTPNKTIVRTSDIRVSQRVCQENITVTQNTTVYNDLLDEIDSTTVKALDSNLFLGDEIREVYTEIMKTVPRDHLNCEEDDLIEKAPEGIDLSGLTASSSLTMRHANDRMINPSLKVRAEAPWGTKENKLEWSKTHANDRLIPMVTPNPRIAFYEIYKCVALNRCPINPPKDSKGAAQFDPLVPSSENIAFARDPHSGKIGGLSLSELPTLVAERMTRAYASWLTWWKSTITSDDYMKYLATQETDYLGVINHFYDSDAEEDNEEGSKSTKIDALNKELENQRNKKLVEMRSKKQEFTPGMWNAQTVLLGGLGRDPDVEDDDEIGRIRSAIEKEAIASQAKKKYLGDIVKERVKSGQLNASQYGGITPRTGVATSSRGFTSKVASTTSGPGSTRADYKVTKSYQDRMEKVWNALYVPDNLKLDMAIKYSSDDYIDNLEQVINAWEAATSLILQREQIISELEAFERLASDPNRFFENGYRGSSGARLRESKLRSQLYMKLDNIRERVAEAVKYVNETYNDTMTYQGRPYLDKMQWDKTEMLYWLQEERKQHAINLYKSLTLKKQDLTMTPLIPQS